MLVIARTNRWLYISFTSHLPQGSTTMCCCAPPDIQKIMGAYLYARGVCDTTQRRKNILETTTNSYDINTAQQAPFFPTRIASTQKLTQKPPPPPDILPKPSGILATKRSPGKCFFRDVDPFFFLNTPMTHTHIYLSFAGAVEEPTATAASYTEEPAKPHYPPPRRGHRRSTTTTAHSP